MNKQQKLVLVVSVLASLVAFLDGSVVNVALPAIVRELGGGLAVQQWVVDAYLMSLGSLILIAGSISDIFGRLKVLRWGLVGFGAASLLCAISPNAGVLIGARALQGIAGALLVPSSLALIMSNFEGKAQGKAIGSWTAWTGIAFVIGPLLGGFLVDLYSWRLIFAINVLPIAITLWLMRTLLKDHARTRTNIDILGALLGAGGLAGTVFALIEQTNYGWSSPLIYGSCLGGIAALIAFVVHESRTPQPMLPLTLFRSRNFSIGNLATLSIYAGLSVATFLVTLFLQQVGKFSATAAGLSLLPVTLLMFVLSPRFGGLAAKHGPRWFMAAGPLLASLGFVSMLRVQTPVSYWTELFPGIILFGIGLSLTVAPLTSAILGAIKPEQAGIGSAVNNAVSRIAGLLAIAGIGVVTGSSLSLGGFKNGLIATALLLAAGGVVSAVGISNSPRA